MRWLWLLALLGLAVWTMMVLLPGWAEAQGALNSGATGILRIEPASSTVEVGSEITIEIWLDNAVDYYGLDLRLTFDAALVTIKAGRATSVWEVFHPTYHFLIKNEVDNGIGELWYAVTNMNPATEFTGTGRVCSLALSGLAPGVSRLDFSYAKGANRNGEAIWPMKQSAAIEVRTRDKYSAYLPLAASPVPSESVAQQGMTALRLAGRVHRLAE